MNLGGREMARAFFTAEQLPENVWDKVLNFFNLPEAGQASSTTA